MVGGEFAGRLSGPVREASTWQCAIRGLEAFRNLALDWGVYMAMKDFVEFSGAVLQLWFARCYGKDGSIPATSARVQLSCQQGGNIDRHIGSARDGANP